MKARVTADNQESISFSIREAPTNPSVYCWTPAVVQRLHGATPLFDGATPLFVGEQARPEFTHGRARRVIVGRARLLARRRLLWFAGRIGPPVRFFP